MSGVKKYDDGLTPQERYHKKNKIQFMVSCMASTEQDVIQWLEAQPNKAGAIKKLIREAIAKEKQ